jgi:hypothetical protein
MPVTGLTGWWGAVLDAPDPQALGRFYSALDKRPIAMVATAFLSQ